VPSSDLGAQNLDIAAQTFVPAAPHLSLAARYREVGLLLLGVRPANYDIEARAHSLTPQNPGLPA
jgi:hypothetical protein